MEEKLDFQQKLEKSQINPLHISSLNWGKNEGTQKRSDYCGAVNEWDPVQSANRAAPPVQVTAVATVLTKLKLIIFILETNL